MYGQSVSDAWEVEKNIDGTRFIIRVSRALQMNDGQRSTTGSTDVTPPRPVNARTSGFVSADSGSSVTFAGDTISWEQRAQGARRCEQSGPIDSLSACATTDDSK